MTSTAPPTRTFWIPLLLWVLWAGLLTLGLLADATPSAGLKANETWLKAGSSLVLVATACWFAWRATGVWHHVARYLAVGMALGSMGDASPLLGNWWPDPQRTLLNMVLFGIGHLAYIRASVLAARMSPSTPKQANGWYASLALWLIAGAVLWYFAAWRGAHHSVLKWPALAYTLLLATTAGATLGTALTRRWFAVVALGAMLFVASDALLAIWIFHDYRYPHVDLVWLTYGLGQMLIVFGALGDWLSLQRD
ncbi:lysoplasmalogenase [Aeoliella mucimassa]|uniref:YhhN-like protein n=1 Tax=Aeoliella mucimassa TaxID=2527972 RepID=A0A518AL69_9BACT|nr:lysoplasmalogenase [Aeoliella mucimassa]QDU55470.1 YhhN-like protein [Aeoliella mucimassa]